MRIDRVIIYWGKQGVGWESRISDCFWGGLIQLSSDQFSYDNVSRKKAFLGLSPFPRTRY